MLRNRKGIVGIIVTLVFVAISMSMSDKKPSINSVIASVASALPSEENQVSSSEINTVAVSTSTADATFYSVEKVVDGDTIKILKDGVTVTIRLIGVDTPETVKPKTPVQCFGKEASAETKRLMTVAGNQVRVVTDSTQGEYDQFGRLLAYVYLPDGSMVEEQLIARGFGREYTYKGSAYKFQQEFKEAQINAKNSGLGLWSIKTCNGKI